MTMKITNWKGYTEDGIRYRIRAEYGVRGMLKPYIAVTGEIQEYDGYWREFASGCVHDEIAEHFPELRRLIALHLVSFNGVPMHYIDNAVYWAEHIAGINRYTNTSNHDPLRALKGTVCFGQVETDTEEALAAFFAFDDLRSLVPSVYSCELFAKQDILRKRVTEWCQNRHEALRARVLEVCEEFAIMPNCEGETENL